MGMLRPLKGELPEDIKETVEGVEEWCEFLSTNTGMKVTRPDFSLKTEVMEVITGEEKTI